MDKPLDMVLHCPQCATQYVDAPDPDPCREGCQYSKDVDVPEGRCIAGACMYMLPGSPRWTNPPHKSHLCHECGCIWRPADVHTNGVLVAATRGKNDTWPVLP